MIALNSVPYDVEPTLSHRDKAPCLPSCVRPRALEKSSGLNSSPAKLLFVFSQALSSVNCCGWARCSLGLLPSVRHSAFASSLKWLGCGGIRRTPTLQLPVCSHGRTDWCL